MGSYSKRLGNCQSFNHCQCLKEIRESEEKSHIEMYSNDQLDRCNGWLKKPIKTVQELIPLFCAYKKLRVLDLGCGVGRNCIEVASRYRQIDCRIDGVDILPLAIEKLNENAVEQDVSENVCGMVSSIEEYIIPNDSYDLIMALSALEHVENQELFYQKLLEIREGIFKNGIACLIINSNIREYDKITKEQVPAQFEINLPTGELQMILKEMFAGWTVLKSTVRDQQYDIPREWGISELKTRVVTLVVRK